MKILRLVTERFRGLADGEHAFSGSADAPPASLVLVSGGPGAGKSTLLQAIAVAKELVGSYGPRPAVEPLLRAGAATVRVEATWVLNEVEMRVAETDRAIWKTGFLLRRGEPAPLVDPGLRRLFSTHPVAAPEGGGGLELFDSDRRLGALPVSYHDESSELASRARSGPDRYRGLLPWLVRTVVSDGLDTLSDLQRRGILARFDRADALAQARGCLAALLPDHHLEAIDPRESRVVFVRRDAATLDVAELSSSERMKILFGLAFLRFALRHGIALMDDIELALAPVDVPRLLLALKEIAPDAQIIATTRAASAGNLPPHHALALGAGPGSAR